MAKLIDNWRAGGTGRGSYTFKSNSAAQVPLIIQGASGQTANLLEIKNYAGTVMYSVDVSGNIINLGDNYTTDTLTVSGNAAITGTLNVSGITVLSAMNAMGATSLSSLSVSGDTILRTLQATNITVNNNLITNSYAYFNRGLYLSEQVTAPTYVAEKGVLYTKDASSITELFYKDSSGNEVQMTSAGSIGGDNVWIPDDYTLGFGNTSASPDATINWETADVSAHYLGIALTTSRNIIISEDRNIDFGHAAQTNPTLWIHSADETDTADWINFAHNQTNAVIGVGTGGLLIDTVGNHLSPATTDNEALGTTSLMWSDLYLASGAVVNFNNGDVTITHAANALSIDGGDTTFLTGAIIMGNATSDCSTFTMIKGAQTSDPQVQFALSADANGNFSITANTGDITFIAADDIFLTATGGAMTFEATNAAADSTVTIQNSDGTYAANLDVEGTVTTESIIIDAAAGTLDFTGATSATITSSGSGLIQFGDDNLQQGSATVDCGTFTMKKGAQSGDPQMSLTLSSDANGHLTIASTGSLILQPSADTNDYITISTITDIPTIYATGSYLRIGDAATTQNSLDSEDDLMVSGELEVYSNFYAGSLQFAADSGLVTAFDMPVSATPADGTVEGYSFAVDSNAILTIYSEADNAGAVDTMRVGIGTIAPTGKLEVAQTISATGALKGIVYTGAVNTNQTLSTEIPAVTITTAGRQWATGALTTQREVLILAPTYSFVGASVITNAATLYVDAAPTASTNATITNNYAVWVDAGEVRIDGSLGDTTNRVASGFFTDLTVTNGIAGSITGNAATVTVADTTDTSCYVALFEDASGSLAAKTDAGITYNAGTGLLTATGFAGQLTGDVTGNCSGTAATVTGATQASITTCANLVTVGTIGTGVWQGTTIKANYLQQAAADLGDVDINLDFSNSNAGNVTNLTIDGALTGGSLTVSTSGVITTGTIELGAASDTTISRTSAGAIAVEGVAVLLSGGALGTPASGTLTNCTGLPAAAVVAGSFGTGAYVMDSSLQVSTIELGHATQNTLSASGGVLSIEGVVIPSISSTNTLTNKRITQRVTTTTDDATAVIDTDTCDVYELSAVANATEFTLTGTPTDGQKLLIRVKDAGVSKALTWTGFTAIGVTLPAATTAGKWHYVGCTYNLAATAWHAIAVTEQA